MVKVMKNILLSLTKQQKEDGLTWYSSVNEFCLHVATNYDIEHWRVAGILAALSPNNKFDRNLQDTVNFINSSGHCKVCTFGANKEKAKQILFNAKSIEDVRTILRGNKTTSFFMNICEPNNENYVTIDLWMNRVFNNDGKSITNKRYRDFSKHITDYANEINLIPQQLQALLWIGARKESF